MRDGIGRGTNTRLEEQQDRVGWTVGWYVVVVVAEENQHVTRNTMEAAVAPVPCLSWSPGLMP